MCGCEKVRGVNERVHSDTYIPVQPNLQAKAQAERRSGGKEGRKKGKKVGR